MPVVEPRRVFLEEVAGLCDPLEVIRRVRHSRHPVLLLSGLTGHRGARFSIVAWDPTQVVTIRGSQARIVRVADGRETVETRNAADPFDLLRQLVPPDPECRVASGIPFVGGAIGYLGYGLRRAVERLPGSPPDPLGQPDAWFGLYDRAIVFDHLEGRTVLVATDRWGGPATKAPAGMFAQLGDALRGGPRPGPRSGCASTPGRRRARLMTDRAAYYKGIARALDYIASGDIYQVNLSHRITCPFDGDPLSLFSNLAQRNPAPFAAFLDAGDFQVVSASPERFVSLAGDRARCSPIKGTRPRGATPEEDRRLAEELLASGKDRAENIMIADLVRNDLGRVCGAGSVVVETLSGLESFATVHHLVTTVGGRLRAGADRVDLLRALFPGGSMTGAPKVRAMEVIDELEGEERGVYSGAIGYLSRDGRMDFSIVIRTLVCDGQSAHFRVGGGIVADSDPDMEHRETLDKARALLDVLNADLVNL